MPTDVKAPHERIEAAVQRVRDVAGKATPGTWTAVEPSRRHDPWVEAGDHTVAEFTNCGDPSHGQRREADAAFVALFDPTLAELVARLLEGEAARWATRPIADWDIYNSTPLAALVRHIVGEEEKA
jgi:hypothetical protein